MGGKLLTAKRSGRPIKVRCGKSEELMAGRLGVIL